MVGLVYLVYGAEGEKSVTGGMGETGEGSRSEVRGFRNFEPRTRTSYRAFLACLALHVPQAVKALRKFTAP